LQYFLSVAIPAPKYSSAQENTKEKIINFLSMPRPKQITVDAKANWLAARYNILDQCVMCTHS